ncbi:myosin heavy chain, cardiac muscle isoform-like isoform X2 [Oscarella lobularis]|uniref:myosin heavy chain, cardiac muscle isoform-like isoform X2 n=1 Tax=Oscarella lobularis TaxID=121494 RepID=UPI0033131C90
MQQDRPISLRLVDARQSKPLVDWVNSFGGEAKTLRQLASGRELIRIIQSILSTTFPPESENVDFVFKSLQTHHEGVDLSSFLNLDEIKNRNDEEIAKLVLLLLLWATDSEKNKVFVDDMLKMDEEIQHGLMQLIVGGKRQIQDGCLERGIFHLPDVKVYQDDIEPVQLFTECVTPTPVRRTFAATPMMSPALHGWLASPACTGAYLRDESRVKKLERDVKRLKHEVEVRNEDIDEFNKRLMEKEEECREKNRLCRELQKKVDEIKHLEDRLEELEPLEQSTKYMEKHIERLQLEIRNMEKYKNEVTEYRAEVSALQREIANKKEEYDNYWQGQLDAVNRELLDARLKKQRMQGELKSTKELLEQKMNEAGQEKEAWIAERRRLVEDVQAKEVELHGLHLQLEAKPQAGESLSLVMSDVSKMMRLEAENEQMQKELEDLKDVKQHFRNADIIASTLKEKESEYIREIGELNYSLKTASQTVASLEHEVELLKTQRHEAQIALKNEEYNHRITLEAEQLKGKEEAEALRENLSKLEEKCAELRAELACNEERWTAERSALEVTKRSLEESVSTLMVKEVEMRSAIQQQVWALEREEENRKRIEEDYSARIERIEEEKKELKSEIASLKGKYDECLSQLKAVTSDKEEASALNTSLANERDDLQAALAQKEESLDALAEQTALYKQNLAQKESLLESTQGNVQELTDELNHLMKKMKEADEQIQELRTTLEEAGQREAETEKQTNQLCHELDNIGAECREKERTLKLVANTLGCDDIEAKSLLGKLYEDKDRLDDVLKCRKAADEKVRELSVEVTGFQEQIEVLEKEYDELKEEKEKLASQFEEKVSSLEAAVLMRENELEAAKTAREALESQWNDEKSTWKAEMDELRLNLDAKNEEIESLLANQKEKETMINHLHEKLDSLQIDLALKKDELKASQDAHQVHLSDWTDEKSSLIDEWEARIESLKSSLDAKEEEAESLSRDLKASQDELEAAKAAHEATALQWNDEKEELKLNLDAKNEEIESLLASQKEKETMIHEKLDALEIDLASKKDELKASQDAHQVFLSEWTDEKSSLIDEWEARIESLKLNLDAKKEEAESLSRDLKTSQDELETAKATHEATTLQWNDEKEELKLNLDAKNEEIESLLASQKEKETMIHEKSSLIDEWEARIESLKSNLEAKEEEAESLSRDLKASQDELETAKAAHEAAALQWNDEKEELKLNLDAKDRDQKEMETLVSQLELKVSDLESNLTSKDDELKASQTARESLLSEWTDEKSALVGEWETRIESLKSNLNEKEDDFEEKLRQSKDEIAELKAKLEENDTENLKARNAELASRSEKLAEVEELVKKQADHIASFSARKASYCETIDALKKADDGHQERCEKAEKDVQSMQKDLQSLNRHLEKSLELNSLLEGRVADETEKTVLLERELVECRAAANERLEAAVRKEQEQHSRISIALDAEKFKVKNLEVECRSLQVQLDTASRQLRQYNRDGGVAETTEASFGRFSLAPSSDEFRRETFTSGRASLAATVTATAATGATTDDDVDKNLDRRILELQRRNARALPHLQSSYPIETQTCTQQNVSQLTDAQQRPSRTAGLRQHTDLNATNPRRSTFTVEDMAQHGPASSQASAAAGSTSFSVPVSDKRMGKMPKRLQERMAASKDRKREESAAKRKPLSSLGNPTK